MVILSECNANTSNVASAIISGHSDSRSVMVSAKIPGLLEPDMFLDILDRKLQKKSACGVLSCIDIQDRQSSFSKNNNDLSTPSDTTSYIKLFVQISDALGGHGIFCWLGERLIVLLDSSSASKAHRVLRSIAHAIAKNDWLTENGYAHLTPAIGYAELRLAKSPRHIWNIVEVALDRAKSSLEIEPFRYVRKMDVQTRSSIRFSPLELWRRVPQSAQLCIQLGISVLLALGAPFVLYAVCDALGSDISGPVYIGVVIVLVITAASIWVEGFLALRPTEPPSEPGAACPVASIIIPAYLPNEADTIVETLNAFLRLSYENTVQIIIAYNCPKSLPVEDELASIAARFAGSDKFIIEPVRVIGSTSKAQNVNAVVGRIKGQFVGIFDADHHPHSDSVQRAWRWISNGWDIVQGRCSIRNGGDSWVSRMVAVEFEQIYAVSHPGRARFHGFGIFGGSNGFWRTSVLHETRMRHSMLTEDIDSSIRAVVAGYKIAGDRNLISEELAPTSLNQLLNQRLRWAQGWFQVSLWRVVPALKSPHVSVRQKLGLIHLLVWRELFPWYSIQVVPIMAYWVWVYGWDYIQWTIPIFLATTIFTVSTGPGQLLFAYILAQKSMRARPEWFLEYLVVSMVFYSPFKDALSRIAHIKEAMRERAWKVTPRTVTPKAPQYAFAKTAIAALLLLLLSLPGRSIAQTLEGSRRSAFSIQHIMTLLGGEASTIHAARNAARSGRNAEAAKLFKRAIIAVPARRRELLSEYAESLRFSNRSAEAVSLYRELLSYPLAATDRQNTLSHLAVALTWSGQPRAALPIYDMLVARSPENVEYVMRRARVLTTIGHHDRAVAALDTLTSSKWIDGPLAKLGEEVLIDAGRNAIRNGQGAVAVRLYDRAILHDATLRSRLLKEYADYLSGANRAAEALPLYREAIDDRLATSANRTDAVLGLAQALARNGQSRKAYQVYMMALVQVSPSERNIPFSALLAKNSAKANLAKVLRSNNIAPDRLTTAARMALAAGQTDDSASLVNKAIAECGGCRSAVLQKFNEQLAQTLSSRDSVAGYRQVMAITTPGTDTYRKAQRNLAIVLARTEGPRKSLEAWTAYVLSNPGDVDAIIHQAQALSALHENARALEAYRAASAIDPQNASIRRGIVDETVNLARIAARNDRNVDALQLLALAMKLDSAKRKELLREYADQLSFGGHAAEAIPLYQEVLGGNLSIADRKAALVGLANATAWAGKADEALARYADLTNDYPQDLSLKWTKTVFAARQAAQTNRNSEAANLFAQAIKDAPNRRGEVLREYADQLNFTGQSAMAIGLYREVLNQPALAEADRFTIKKGLAQAYDWVGQVDEAKPIYAELIAKYPTDASWRWKLLVMTARQAARQDRNKDAARLFADAIMSSPKQSMSIVREYADQLSFTGRAAIAVGFYRLTLNQPALSDADRVSAEKGLARAYDWSSQFSEAKAAYAALVEQFPKDDSLKWGFLVASARDAAKADRNKEAAALFADAIKLLPDLRTSLLKEYADKLTFSGNAKQAIPLYRELIAQGKQRADVRTHMLSLALAFAWDNQPMAAHAEYQALMIADPDDVEAGNGAAQMLAWSGNHAAARLAYQALLRRHPKDPVAQRGLAKTEMWQGRQRSAQAMLIQRIADDPSDLEARRLLAQSQYWSGRPDKAMTQLKIALRDQLPGPLREKTQLASANISPPDSAGTQSMNGLGARDGQSFFPR